MARLMGTRRSSGGCSRLCLALVIALAGGSAEAQLAVKRVRANSPFGVKTDDLKKVETTSGFGAIANHARAGGDAAGDKASLSPEKDGKPFDDTTMIDGPAGAKVPALTKIQTSIMGAGLRNSYPDSFKKDDELKAGQSIRYDVETSTDKITPALTNGEYVFGDNALAIAESEKTVATATGSLRISPNAKNNKAVDVDGAARAEIAYDNPLGKGNNVRGFAASIVRDPITYTIASGSSTGLIGVSIGGATNPLVLQATEPGSLARAFYDFGTDRNGILVSFDMSVSGDATSIADVGFHVDTISPLLGFGSANDFKNHLFSYLSFDPNSHTLAASSGIPLYSLALQPGDSSVTLSFTAGALASAAVPEPTPLALAAIATLVVVVSRRGLGDRRRARDESSASSDETDRREG